MWKRRTIKHPKGCFFVGKGRKHLKKTWIFNKAEDSAELLLYGSISDESWFGDEVTPQQFTADLKDLGDIKSITVRINSPGGDVFAALAISSILRDHPASITALIDGYCASAATIITAFADKSQASANSMFVIHNTSTVAAGDYRVMDKASEILRKSYGALSGGRSYRLTFLSQRTS
jgi:ATP-dependent protease ClpP protease subunit